MIIEQHYDDEVLIELLDEAEEDTHVPACDTCSGTLESYRDLSGALHDDSVWDERELSETPSPQTTNFLRAFADRTRAEDIAAGPIVAKLIADPSAIDQHPEWRTAGVVRGLLKVVDAKNFSEPKVAADLAALAVKVADSLEPTLYPRDAVTKVRATAWRELAYALNYIGSYKESLDAVDHIDALLLRCSVSEFEIGRARLLRAQILNQLEELDEALQFAENALVIFRKFEDVHRECAAEATRAGILMQGQRFAEALTIHMRLASDLRIDETSRALAFHHAAICESELAHFESAKTLFRQAVSEFERLGQLSRRAKARSNLAGVLLREGQYEQSFSLFKAVHGEFRELGIAQDVALSSVNAAEALLMLGRTDEVAPLCHASMEYFTNAGLEYTQGALMALAYLKEAAQDRKLNTGILTGVRAYFEVLPKQPHLLFAFPL